MHLQWATTFGDRGVCFMVLFGPCACGGSDSHNSSMSKLSSPGCAVLLAHLSSVPVFSIPMHIRPATPPLSCLHLLLYPPFMGQNAFNFSPGFHQFSARFSWAVFLGKTKSDLLPKNVQNDIFFKHQLLLSETFVLKLHQPINLSGIW